MRFQERYSNYLMHFGVPGMKWGVRKSRGSNKRRSRTHKLSYTLNPMNKIRERKRQKAKAQKIKEISDYIKDIKSMPLSDFMSNEIDYLDASGRISEVNNIKTKKQWEDRRKAVIEEQEEKLRDWQGW